MRTSPRPMRSSVSTRSPGHLHVRLGLAEPLAGRVERHRRLGRERLEVGQPALGVGTPPATTTNSRCGRPARERGHEHRVAGAGEPARPCGAPSAPGSVLSRRGERGELLDGVEERGKRHRQAARGGGGRAARGRRAPRRQPLEREEQEAAASSGAASARRPAPP
jgi:hypothetical protein